MWLTATLTFLLLTACAHTERIDQPQKLERVEAVQDDDVAVHEAVTIFITYYGTADMGKVADVVTPNFRDGKSKLEWAYYTGSLLAAFAYERLENEITQVVIDGDEAYVHVRATIETFIGLTEQDELFRVVKDSDGWKVDALEIVNEKIHKHSKEL